MKKNCWTCKHQPIPPDLEPCLHCLRLPPIFRRSDGIDRVDNWQPAKQLRKELQAEIDRLKQINRMMKDQLDIATDLGEKRFREIERLKAAITTLKSENQALYIWRTSSADKLAKKDAEISELRRHVSEVMKREDALKKQAQAKPDLLPVGTRVMLTGIITEIDKEDAEFPYEIKLDNGDYIIDWYPESVIKVIAYSQPQKM